jgi:zinc/manganese transport system substrate-binding protein
MVAICLFAILAGTTLVAAYFGGSTTSLGSSKIQVVAGENFWGSLVSQLGGKQVQVLSIVTDPNADPHEYESNSADARAFASASLIIINGAGYDSWAQQLISAENNPNQTVLNVQELVGQTIGANPHFWYSPFYVNETVMAMYKALKAIDPANTTYFEQQYANLNASLGQYNQRIAAIKSEYAGTPVASTESIFVYLANATGLDLVSPPAFMKDISDGIDPSAQDVATFQNQLTNGTAKLLVYNTQTVTPITTQMESLANTSHIPIAGISETVQPPNALFQYWMNNELISLQHALASVNG